MADSKISGLPAATSLTGAELVEVVQSGANKRTTPSQIANLVTLASLGAATAAQGGLADTAVQPGDLGSAATANTGDFATAAQGATADAAQAAHADQRIFGFLPAGPIPTLSWSEATWTLTLVYAGEWSYYRNSVKYTVTGNKSVTLPGTPPASGMWWIRIASNDGTLSASQTPWALGPTDSDVTVCSIEINNALTPKSHLYTEMHLCDINRGMHRYEHLASGPKLVSGGVVSGYTLTGNTTAANTFGVSQAYYMDETLGVTVPALVDDDGATLKYLVRSRLAGAFTWTQSLVPYLYVTNGFIRWDNAGTLTEAASGVFVNTYLLATQAGWQLITGQASHGTLAAAQAETFQSLNLTGLQLADYIAVAQLTWRTGNYGGLGKCRLETFAKITVSSITVGTSTGLPALHASTHDAAGSDPLTGYLETTEAVTAPTASKIPLADANARVDGDWIGVLADKLTTAKDAFNELTAVQQYLIFNMEGLAGYWPADPAYLYQDSAGYTPATVGGVVGQVRDISNAATPVARRNLLTYSEQFDNAAWVKTACTVEASSVPSPDGTATAQLIRDIIGGLTYTYATYASVSVLSTDTLTYSIYLKAGTSSSGQIEIGSTTDSQRAIAIFNLTNKTITVGYNGGGTVTNSVRLLELSGGWFRASISIATNSAYNAKAVLTFWNTNGLDFHVCDGTNNMYIWGAQLELGAEATPYQKIVTGTGDVFAPGNHAYQTTTANKPYLRVTPTSGVHWLDSNTATSALTATLGNLGSACTVCRAGAEGVTFTEGVTISSTYNLVPYDASELIRYCADVAIFDRALTITEKALLTRYMGRGVPIVTNGSIY